MNRVKLTKAPLQQTASVNGSRAVKTLPAVPVLQKMDNTIHINKPVQREKVVLDKDIEVEPGAYHESSPLADAVENEDIATDDFSTAESLNEYLDELGYTKSAKFRSKAGNAFPKTGWKFHISAQMSNALEVAQSILPLLIRFEAEHKVDVSDGWDKPEKDSQLGKFITVYPSDDKSTVTMADILNRKLKSIGLAGIPIPNEYQVGNTGMLYMRHGQLKACTFTEYKKSDIPIKNNSLALATDFKIGVEMTGYDSIYIYDDVIFFIKGKSPFPAMEWGGKLHPDPRESPNAANANLPQGMSMF